MTATRSTRPNYAKHVEQVRKALKIRNLDNYQERDEKRALLTIAYNLQPGQASPKLGKAARANALTAAIEWANIHGRDEINRINSAIDWYADNEPDVYEMAEYAAEL